MCTGKTALITSKSQLGFDLNNVLKKKKKSSSEIHSNSRRMRSAAVLGGNQMIPRCDLRGPEPLVLLPYHLIFPKN